MRDVDGLGAEEDGFLNVGCGWGGEGEDDKGNGMVQGWWPHAE